MKYAIDQHYLRHNRVVRLPAKVLYLDVETKKQVVGDEEHHRMKLGWTCYINKEKRAKTHREVWTYFDKTYNLCKYIESKTSERYPLYLFGHNIYFDLQSSDFFYFFIKWKWELSFYYDKGLTYILVIHKGKRNIKVLSSTNYWPCSLREVGQMLGLEKQEVDFESCTDKELSVYCKNDVKILKQSMEYYFQFVKEHDLGRFALTRAGQSFTAFRHRFMYKKIAIHGDAEISAIEREAYYGGRVECFRFGKQPLDDYVLLDINSMYPYIMKTCPVPVRTLDIAKGLDISKLQSVLDSYGAIAYVSLDTDEPCYAYRVGGKIVFPVGNFDTYVCTEGLRYAFEHGHLKSIHKLVLYEMAIIFHGFVDYFYALRSHYKKENNPLMEEACKILMNSLYGKFGQKCTIEDKRYEPDGQAYYRIESISLKTHEQFMEYKMFNTKVVQIGEKEARHSFVGIPAHITEYARFLLWMIVKSIGTDKVFYCDTDSVVCRKIDIDSLQYPISKTELGALSVKASFRNFIINGAKNYVMGNVVKIKGVPRTATKIGDYEYEYPEFLRSANHLRRKITRYYIIKRTPKVVEPFYDKGEVHLDGTISPFRL